MNNLNFEALYLGPQSENRKYFKELLNFLVDEHIHWRRNFHPDDVPCITLTDQRREDFADTMQRMQDVLHKLSAKLKTSSWPAHSPRYAGHMISDVLMPALLAYMSAMMYNPNNVAYEASPPTTALELEAGRDLCRMMGFEPEKSFGHITSGGHVANYEAIWVARNLKSIPSAIKEAFPEHPRTKNLSEYELLNLSPSTTLDLLDSVDQDDWNAVRACSIRGKGLGGFDPGKIIIPQSAHYSWAKAVDVLGLGQQALVPIGVTGNYRMDIGHLRRELEDLAARKIPVLAVVGVAGSTEEGAVDEIHKIVALRTEFESSHGMSFSIHVDAAYGGYARSVFLDEEVGFLPWKDLKRTLHTERIIAESVEWPDQDVYDAFKALAEVDSVTIDPHKMGYVPYQAGAVAFKDERVRNVTAYFPPYLFAGEGEEAPSAPPLLGSFILEGSKAGAAAAAVWAAHRTVGLNVTGYGRIIGESIEGAHRFHEKLCRQNKFVGGEFEVVPLAKPDLNIVVYGFNRVGNTSLKEMDDLNKKVKDAMSYKPDQGAIHKYDFILSSTDLKREEAGGASSVMGYGNTPADFISRLGIPPAEWETAGSVFVLRSCLMSPYLTPDYTEETYLQKLWETFEKVLGEL